MKNFLEHLKETCLPGVWSKGVQLSRVLNSIEKTSPEGVANELRFKVSTQERTLAFEVTLWPDEDDAHCNCGSKVEPCHHIVATALALENGTLKNTSDASAPQSLRLEYSWVYQKPSPTEAARIKLKRTLWKGSEEVPLPASLIAWVGGIQSGRLEGPLPSLSPIDLKIDGLYSSDSPDWKVVIETLSELPPLAVSGHPSLSTLRVQKLPESPTPRLRQLSKDEWTLEFHHDSEMEFLASGLWIKNGVLGYLRAEPSGLPKRFTRKELETRLLLEFPELSALFSNVTEIEPELKLTLHPLADDRFSATLRIHYDADPIDSDSGAILIRDPKKEALLARQAREHYQLTLNQPKTLTASELFLLRNSVSTQRFPEMDSVLGSYLAREFELGLPEALSGQESLLKLLRLREAKPSTSSRVSAMVRALAKPDYKSGNSPRASQVLKSVSATLREYQKEGVNWLLDRWQNFGGAILADDMGLGKTIQTLAILESPSLVVMPVSLLQNWKAEAARFRPDLKVSVYHGAARKKDATADVVLTSYSLFGSEAEHFNSTHWKLAVLDEAHIIRNPETRAAIASTSITADFRLALTGTPVQNRMRDLWSLFQFVSPGLFDGIGAAGEDALDLKTTKPFILRRTKGDVLPELPPKTRLVHTIPFTEAESRLYRAVFDAAKQEVLARIEAAGEVLSPLTLFEVLLRARQACNHEALLTPEPLSNHKEIPTAASSKLDAILSLVSELLEAGHSVLVYSQWTRFLDLLETRMNHESIPLHRLDGSTRDRGSVTREFQESERATAFLLSLHAGGVGLNLTRASHVIFCEPWWNPFVELQAEDRAYRMGQEKPVTIHRFQMENSIEVQMSSLQEQKLALGEAALSTQDLRRFVQES